jgi:hypothetical protein
MNIQLKYSSELTIDSPKYCRDYKLPNYYYQTLQINIMTTDSYTLWSESEIDTYGYIYKDDFDPLQPFGNLLFQHSGKCNQGQLKFIVNLQANTDYILLVTTYYPNITGNFTIFISGQNNVTVNHFSMYLIQYFVNKKDVEKEHRLSTICLQNKRSREKERRRTNTDFKKRMFVNYK